jgi:hypothetical protein
MVPPLISLFDGHGGGEGVSLHHQEEDVIEGATGAIYPATRVMLETIASTASHAHRHGVNDTSNIGAIARASPSVAAVVLFFGTIIFATAAMTARTVLSGDYQGKYRYTCCYAAMTAQLCCIADRLYCCKVPSIPTLNGNLLISPRTQPTALKEATARNQSPAASSSSVQLTFISVYTLLFRTSMFALLLMVCYLLEHHPIYTHTERDMDFDSDYLWFLIILLGIGSATTISRNDGREVVVEAKNEASFSKDDNGLSNNKKHKERKNQEQQQQNEQQQQETHNPLLDLLSPPPSKPKHTNEPRSSKSTNSVSSYPYGKVGSGMRPAKNGISPCCSSVGIEGTQTKAPVPSSAAELLPANDILSRSQSLELKGLCELIFLVTQYTHAKAVSEYSNLQQVVQSTFLFLSGFSHFTYFYTTNDYSLSRVMRQLFRINILGVFLCLSQSTPYILYNAMPLHSFYFLLIYVVMKFGSRSISSSRNSTDASSGGKGGPSMFQQSRIKSFIASNSSWAPSPTIVSSWLSGGNYSKYFLRVKFFLLGCAIFIIWDIDWGFFQVLFFPFVSQGPPMEGAPLGPLWEWYFRSSLHHWATLIGALFGLNAAITSLFMRQLDQQHSTNRFRAMLAKFTATGVVSMAAIMFWTGPYHFNRYEYNDVNGYFAFVPILGYLWLRNATTWLRQYSIGLLRHVGSLSLEMFLLHHHILLSSNGKTVLMLLPGYPQLNLLLVGCLYYWVCRTFNTLSLQLRDMLLPQGNAAVCLRSVLALTCTVLGYYLVALSLYRMKMMSPGALWALILICGILLYQTVMDTTWSCPSSSSNLSSNTASAFNNSNDPSSSRRTAASSSSYGGLPEHESGAAKMSPPIVGTIVIMLLGTSWEAMASLHPNVASGKVSSLGDMTLGARTSAPLPYSCASEVNKGKWIPIDSCSEYHKSLQANYYHTHPNRWKVASVSDCASVTSWAWERPASGSSLCRFSFRDAATLQELLKHRSLVFMGGTTTRHLYHAVCRALGDFSDEAAGHYDPTVPQHSDVIRYFGDTSVEFKWAPLAAEAASKLKEFHSVGNAGPDVILVSGGPWDTLHLWATNNEEDPKHHQAAVRALATEMTRLQERQGISTVWLVPPTINTPALNHADKRLHMSEIHVDEMRQLYERLGIHDAATFVLDGRALTSSQDKVYESFDGIHYPPYIYDVGAQIFMNSMDWVLPHKVFSREHFDPPRPGALANPFLGIMMLCICFIGLFFFDGFMGCLHLAALFFAGGSSGNTSDGKRSRKDKITTVAVRSSMMPSDLYREAFSALHTKYKLPRIPPERSSSAGQNNSTSDNGSRSTSTSGNEERMALLDRSISHVGSGPGMGGRPSVISR